MPFTVFTCRQVCASTWVLQHAFRNLLRPFMRRLTRTKEGTVLHVLPKSERVSIKMAFVSNSEIVLKCHILSEEAKMFYHLEMQREISLHPKYFGGNLKEVIKAKLYSELEGSCNGEYGVVISVTSMDTIGHGIIQPGRGFVVFPVKFKALVFRPFKGQVIDGTVFQVTKAGLFVNIGPLTCFVSRQCVPPDMEFCPDSVPASYRNEDETVVYKEGDDIRVKLIGLRVDPNDIFSIGTLMEDYLGLCTFE